MSRPKSIPKTETVECPNCGKPFTRQVAVSFTDRKKTCSKECGKARSRMFNCAHIANAAKLPAPQRLCVCQDCGIPIPLERLEALPDTLHCVNCSQETPRTSDTVDVDGEMLRADAFKVISSREGSDG